jgi:hypothetical protein
LKPEWWGSPLAQGKCQVRKTVKWNDYDDEDNNNNNNNNSNNNVGL